MTGRTQNLIAGSTSPSDAVAPLLQGTWLRAARVGWVVTAAAVFGVLLASLPGYAFRLGGQLGHIGGASTPPGAYFIAAASGVASLVSSGLSIGLAALLYHRKFNEPIAALLSFFLLVYGVVMAGPLEHVNAILPGFLPIAQTIQGVVLATPTIALLMLFPTGRFVPGWTRWVLLFSIPWNIALILIAPFDAEGLGRYPGLSAGVAVTYIAFCLIGIYAQVYRYRRAASPAERGQIRWAVYGFTLWIGYMLVSTVQYVYLLNLAPEASPPWWAPASELGWWLSLNILPVCLTIAIMRNRLWDIDLVINRTLVYGALTAGVVGLYALIVGGLGLLFQSSQSVLFPLLATGLAAVLFQPLRQRLQGVVNRMMYGDRDDPVALLAKLGAHLETTGSPEAVLAAIVQTAAQALKLPYVAIELGATGELSASYGLPANRLVRYPLIHHGEVVGHMLAAERAPGEALTPKDHQLLTNVARQAGAAAHAARLTADLRRSRQRLITTREEERRRLRRDLHDGLGPSLAAQTLKIGSARALMGQNPTAADRLLRQLELDIDAALVDIRRLVYDLRPPELDELGLVVAIHACAARYGEGAEARPHISVEAPSELPPLPAAVEVAAYRIVQEALTNVVRHARARRCRVRLELNDGLRLVISDDGVGLPADRRAGVGLNSMRERAAELGGSCVIESVPEGGTRVVVWLPLAV